ncbi:MAG: hypothetical protein HOW73_27155 [Polyangiaceae bacterium]|nr:hypothetical protein [Polyangiaceae bacterium]
MSMVRVRSPVFALVPALWACSPAVSGEARATPHRAEAEADTGAQKAVENAADADGAIPPEPPDKSRCAEVPADLSQWIDLPPTEDKGLMPSPYANCAWTLSLVDGQVRAAPHADPANARLQLPYMMPVTGGLAAFGSGNDAISDGLMNRGEVLFVHLDGVGWPTTRRVDLTGTPRAVGAETDGSILVATRDRIVRITDRRPLEVVHGFASTVYGANSIVTMPDGTVFVGASPFVVRLTPTENDMVERWLVPPDAQPLPR